jgi:hypothetical protein
MTKPSLTQLYRQGLAPEATAGISALLRDLAPSSAGLARDLAVLHAPAHARRSQVARVATPARRRESGWQWGAIAACFIAGIALWAARGTVPQHSPSALAQAGASEDRIFTWAMSSQQVASEKSDARGDRIFSSDSADRRDQIFDGSFGGG